MKSMMKNLGRKLGVAIGLVGLVGCAEIQQGARSPFAQNLAANAIGSAVGDVIHQEIQSQYPENIPQTNISVNNYQGGQTPTQTYTEEQYRQLQQQRQAQPVVRQQLEPEFYTLSRWVDLNNDGELSDLEELFGLNKKNFSLNNEPVGVILIPHYYRGGIIFRSWKENGEKIGETNYNISKNWTVGDIGDRNVSPKQGNFMDRLVQSGPGDYRITATLDNGKNYSVDIKLTE